MSNQLSRRQFLTLSGSAAAVLGLGLVGCGSSSSSSDSSSASTESGSGVSGKSFVIAMDTVYAPFEYTDENGDFVGIDVDILNAVADDQGFTAEINSLGFDAALAALESGQADGVIAGMSITDERKKSYDFSDGYYETYVSIAAKAGGDIKSLDDIKGKTVAAKTATIGASCAESLKDEYDLTITYFDTTDLMFQDTLTGNSVVCFEDYPVMAYGITQGNGFEIIDTVKGEFAAEYGFAVKKGENADLLEAFNAGLKNIKDSGKYDEICAKYLGE